MNAIFERFLTLQDFVVLKRLVAENFKKFLPKYILAIFLMLVGSSAAGLTAWLSKDLIDKVLINRDVQMMYIICISVVVIYVIKGFSSYGQEIILARIGNRIVAETQRKVYNSVIAQDISFFQKNSAADLVTRISYNAQAASSTLNLLAVSFGRDVFTIISLLVVMILQDAVLTCIAFLGAPILFAIVTRLLKKTRELFSSEVKSLSSIIAVMQETVYGIRVIRAFQMENLMRKQMGSSVAAVERLSNRMVSVQAAINPIIDTLGGVAIASVVLYASWSIFYDAATPGQFFSFITALLLITDPARRLARLHISVTASVVGVRMLYDLIDTLPSTPEGIASETLIISEGKISLSGVTFGYDPDKPVLDNINIVALAGQITALVGQSGSGKSTIFNLLLSFWRPQAGVIKIDETDLSMVSQASLYDAIGLVGQDVFLFEGTVAENILHGRPGATKEQMIEAARLASAHDFITALPQGYETSVGGFGGQLSGGERQRIAIARAFLKNPKILLLDEPTSALDVAADLEIRKSIQRLMKGRTTIIIAHRLATIAEANCIYVLEYGRVLESGTHQDLIASQGRYAHLVKLSVNEPHRFFDAAS
ncbi:MAG: ABC transporter ATP-binding protein [Acetobacteraceae bacterium]|nr:ABC transporter ATP-binding protein [Acetobacteraceae bacterium]